MFTLFILCLTFSSVEGWKFRSHAGETQADKKTGEKEDVVVDKVNEPRRKIFTARANWHFEGNDGSWEEPIDLRDEKSNSEQACHSDSPQEELTVAELVARNKILNQVRPWKVPKEKSIEKTSLGVAPTEINTFYYINADGDNAREHFMTLQMRAKISAEVTVQRWPLVNVTNLEEKAILDELKQYSQDTFAEYLKEIPRQDELYAVSSYISTMRLLNEIRAQRPQPNDLFVIAEDDVQLSPDWEEELLGHMKHLPQDWDVARFVYWGAKRCQDLVPGKIAKSPWYEARGWKVKKDPEPLLSFGGPTTPPPLHVPHSKEEVGEAWYSGNQAYIIRAGSIPDILAQAKALPVMHVDGVFSSGHQEGWRRFDEYEVPWSWGIHSYALSMPLGHQVPHEEVERHDRPSLGSEM
jgi:hypothetical protein